MDPEEIKKKMHLDKINLRKIVKGEPVYASYDDMVSEWKKNYVFEGFTGEYSKDGFIKIKQDPGFSNFSKAIKDIKAPLPDDSAQQKVFEDKYGTSDEVNKKHEEFKKEMHVKWEEDKKNDSLESKIEEIVEDKIGEMLENKLETMLEEKLRVAQSNPILQQS